ncbi:MAG: cellulase family glycosylhydrolase [Bacteroidota bacterium]
MARLRFIPRIFLFALLSSSILLSCESVVDGDEQSNLQTKLIAPVNSSTNESFKVTLKWEPVSEAREFKVMLSDQTDFETAIIDTTVDESLLDTPILDPDKTYFWRVRPVTGRSNAEWSPVWRFTIAGNQSTPVSNSFVQVQNGDFVIDGNPFRFAGTNAYYLPNYEKLNSAVVDRALDLFRDTEVKVVRMWGFYDGYDCGYSKDDPSENVIQTAPGEYSEEALQDLDRVIAKGKERGIRFIIPFINYWDQLGGVCQYNTWAGASDPSTNMEFFLSNSQTQEWYKDYISMLLNRVNTVTGIAYKDEPTIMAWQIMNEGRNSGKDPAILRDWYQEIARYIKSIDSNHLISTGEEGFDEGTPAEYSADQYSNAYALRANEGTSYKMNTSIPEIDFGNAHWYPTEYGFGMDVDEDMRLAQKAWLEDHQAIAEQQGKPFMIGEFGFPGWSDDRVKTNYRDLYAHAEAIDLDGNLLWQLVADGTKCWEFGGNICHPGGREDTELYNDFRNHVLNMQ